VVLGEFGRPHGLAGEVRLKSHTEDPRAIAGYGPLVAADGRRFVLTSVRQAAGDQPDLLVVRVEGVTSREAAEALNRLRLHVERERLGAPEEDEFFLADLVGLPVEGPEGLVGRIVAVPDYGGGPLLEIALDGRRRTELLPFTLAFVPNVDIAGGRVVIEPPGGWLDEAGDASG
jgi:16S rRNA processing protein RimM